MEVELTSILPSITVTGSGRAWVCVGNQEVPLYGVDVKPVGGGVRKSMTIAEAAGRKYGHCTVTQRNLLR